MTDAPETLYQSTQVAWPFVIAGLVLLAVVAVFAIARHQPIASLAAVAMAGILVFFSTLRVEVTRADVAVRFGPLPLVGRTIPMGRIQAVSVAHSAWWTGWGVRLIRGGMLYTAASRNVVELALPEGRRVQIGTPEPEVVRAAVEQARGPAPG
ncbi:hypothetical protein F1188_19985 [Roseospira marina]|uniref:PH domain-containing protein n=1 Tax=Roseospira marina TaxID=140057 RepID=A0A5M6I620_9PROT|nr:hypothetical protein [Roseospira marina]KAA5603228.1 hypothetical protein F1188_19985 [Roseospira marina]MBB4316198.1 membrane protein YdbS with pleckstrin-like domain [Roseospira marina]MBB5089396.1 membrane protein YdbS with pleckstrin-like domain [Roseospira marina]